MAIYFHGEVSIIYGNVNPRNYCCDHGQSAASSGNSGLGYLDAKHFQFAMDSRRAVAGAPQSMLFRDIVRISLRGEGQL
jgi:hypothetical protein